MKTKELSEVEKTVETFITVDCAVKYSVMYTGEEIREDWKRDCWRFTIKNQSFEYFTGFGLREDVTAATKKRAAYEFTSLTEKDVAGKTMYGRRYLQRVQELRRPQIPPVAGLLYSLILDSSACNESFESWCMELGYDSDSRKALVTYMACQENADKLHRVFTPAQSTHIQELLQDY